MQFIPALKLSRAVPAAKICDHQRMPESDTRSLEGMAENETPTTYVPNSLLSRLVGFRMYSVTFVLNDYIQLRFDGDSEPGNPYLNVEAWPAVEVAGRVWRESDLGYADALRRLTPGIVQFTSERVDDGIRLGLDTGLIHINPIRSEVVLEIALLDGFADRHWMCWRPGEDSFEHVV